MFPVMIGNLFATKGPEYLLVIGFLVLLVPFWKWLSTGGREYLPRLAQVDRGRPARSAWFRMRRDAHYHPGHAWASGGQDDTFRVGVDDFAQRLLGTIDAIQVPQPGSRVEQGRPGWTLSSGGAPFDVLSPLDGEVVAVNTAALESPAEVNDDPYGRGWLLEVRADRPGRDLRNLLQGDVAEAWMAQAEDSIRNRIAGSTGEVLQDGGVPVSGIARAIEPERWQDLARRFLRTA